MAWYLAAEPRAADDANLGFAVVGYSSHTNRTPIDSRRSALKSHKLLIYHINYQRVAHGGLKRELRFSK